MKQVSIAGIVLPLVMILTILVLNENILAEPPCNTKQTQSGEVVPNKDMELKWAAGHPPNSITAGTSVPVAIDGGLGAYNWMVTRAFRGV